MMMTCSLMKHSRNGSHMGEWIPTTGVGQALNQARANVAKWRGLSTSTKVRNRRAVVVKRVVSSMAMEGEPVSASWVVLTNHTNHQPRTKDNK